MVPVRRLNHAVLFVRDVERSVAFYRDVLGMEPVAREAEGRAVFMRAPGSGRHHDLGLFTVGEAAPSPPPGSVGLYHLAWEVERVEDLVALRRQLADAGALGGQSDHGATKSLYGRDPDGNEFEIMWQVPAEEWGAYADSAPILPLDLDAEVARYGGR
ncbi:MAG TPA: VOC family protein [Acidimicrobiales bacterium]|nr:VOC family protein [Acidimicrobiales bacterium]